MTHDEWIKARRLGVTGSDISVLLGHNKYKSEDDLILDKLGVGKPFSGNEATRAGQRLEPLVANQWALKNQTIIINGSFTVSQLNDRFIGTPDFITGFYTGLEIKTGAEHIYKSGIPAAYCDQSRWYMMITDRPAWDLYALIVPKDRSEIPSDPDELEEWISFRPIREARLERDPAWEDRAQMVANQFLARLDALRMTSGSTQYRQD